jgi:hypothetical protein
MHYCRTKGHLLVTIMTRDADDELVTLITLGELTREQSAYNAAHSHVRGQIERWFGKLKLRFRILDVQFRHRHDKFNPIFRFCCALTNVERRLELERGLDAPIEGILVWNDPLSTLGMF